jgi:hypothetical protein
LRFARKIQINWQIAVFIPFEAAMWRAVGRVVIGSLLPIGLKM